MDRFFQKPHGPSPRKQEHAGKVLRRFRPKVPDLPQKTGKPAPVEHRAAQDPCHQIPPQFSLRRAQKEHKGSRPHRKAVREIDSEPQPGKTLAEGAQQIIRASGTQAQQNGSEEEKELSGDRHGLHGYPKSRPKSPVRSGPPSS